MHYRLATGRVARRLSPTDADVLSVLSLIQRSFAYMDGRVDPPSSVHRLDLASLARQCTSGEVWCIGTAPDACVVLTPTPPALYLGKLAVDSRCRGQGLARSLVALANDRAVALALDQLELEVRVELVENQVAFGRLGFVKVGATCHAGYDRPTSFTMRRPAVSSESV